MFENNYGFQGVALVGQSSICLNILNLGKYVSAHTIDKNRYIWLAVFIGCAICAGIGKGVAGGQADPVGIP